MFKFKNKKYFIRVIFRYTKHVTYVGKCIVLEYSSERKKPFAFNAHALAIIFH